MISIRDLRASLQAPREAADTWYGKWMARSLSIYVTWLLARLGFGPNLATLLSLVFALIGVVGLARGNFAVGIFGLNLWYLLDHVDGELARLRNSISLSGTFFDTVINFLIQPFTFLSWGFGLVQQKGWEALLWGAVATLGSLMLLAIPMTEEAVLFNHSRKMRVVYQKISGRSSSNVEKQSFFRRGFGFIHTLVTFPSVLCIMTIGYLVLLIFAKDPLYRSAFLYRFLMAYAFVVTVVWILQLFNKVYFHTLDRRWKPVSGA